MKAKALGIPNNAVVRNPYRSKIKDARPLVSVQITTKEDMNNESKKSLDFHITLTTRHVFRATDVTSGEA